MTSISSKAFSAVLLVLGVISSFVAVNVAFGGLETLGWQGPRNYLARLTQLDLDTVLGPDLLVSTIVELVGMPLLFLWLHRLTQTSTSAQTSTTAAPA